MDSYKSKSQLREDDTVRTRRETNRWRINVPRKDQLSSDYYEEIVATAQETLDNCGVVPDDIDLVQSHIVLKAAEFAVYVGDFASVAGANTEDVLKMVGSITSQAVELFKVDEHQGK